jgi:hypothetical protein
VRKYRRMARLEDAALAKMRDRMMKSDMQQLLDIIDEIDTSCKGGNEHMDYKEVLTRDVYAYAIVKILNVQECVVFGGFVAAHISGKVWRDIDILLPKSLSTADASRMGLRLVPFLRFLFGLTPLAIRIVNVQYNGYAQNYNLRFCIDAQLKFDISIDFVHANTHSEFIPVSVGRCLQLTSECVTKRSMPETEVFLASWSLDDILQKLRAGSDVALCCTGITPAFTQAYNAYFWKRIKDMRDTGYIIDEFIGLPPVQDETTES